MCFQNNPFFHGKLCFPCHFLGFWNGVGEREVDVEQIQILFLETFIEICTLF